jgi:hypothetical protein
MNCPHSWVRAIMFKGSSLIRFQIDPLSNVFLPIISRLSVLL